MTPRSMLAAIVAGLALGACSERPPPGPASQSDTQAYQGAPASGSVAGGWTAGDRASWEAQMRNRAQNQNEYVRAGGTR